MKKTFLLASVAFFTLQTAYASTYAINNHAKFYSIEEVSEIKGTVIDSNGMPVAYASVEIYKADELIDGTLTDGDGAFVLNQVNYGEYILKITVVGMKPYEKSITISSENTDIGQVILNSDVIELNTLEVRAETSKVTNQIDKRVIEVGKDLVSAGAAAGDVLNNIPSLSVDQQSGELSLRGNSNVRVFVDGKPSSIPVSQLLKQLPSNSIAKIEIITNPSAKYDPEGNSGIINIITVKEKRKGYNVSTDFGVTIGRNERYNASVNTNFNTGKLNLFGNYSTNFGNQDFIGDIINYTTGLDQDLYLDIGRTSHLVKAGFDWFINDNSALTVYTNQSFNDSDFDIFSTINQMNSNNLYDDKSFTNNNGRNQDYSLNFSQDFEKEGHGIELDAFYSIGNDDNTSRYNWESAAINLADIALQDQLKDYNQNQDQSIQNTRIKLDYTYPISEKGKIESGLNFVQEGTENTLATTQYLPLYDLTGSVNETVQAQDTYFDFTRNILAAYINLGYQWGKIGMQAGLRGEQVNLDADTQLYGSQDIADAKQNISRENFNLYPSVFFTYQATEADQFSLNYSRRVDRPGVWSLSPIRQWQTATVRQEGNPNLKPQFTDSYELGYMHTFGRKGSLNASIFYRNIHDEMSQLMYVDEVNPNIIIIKRANIDANQSYGAEISWYYKAMPWWNVNGGVNLYQSTIKSAVDLQGDQREVDNTNLFARLSNDFSLSKTLKLQLFTMYIGKENDLQGTQEPMFRQDIGLRKTFFNNTLTATARVSDVFNTFYAQYKMDYPQKQKAKFNWESQTFYFGLSYNFGGKVKTRANKQQNKSETGNGGGIMM